MFSYAWPSEFNRKGFQEIKKRECNSSLNILTWQTQTWQLILLDMSVRKPRLIPHKKRLLTNTFGKIYSLIQNETPTLAAWKVSGKV